MLIGGPTNSKAIKKSSNAELDDYLISIVGTTIATLLGVGGFRSYESRDGPGLSGKLIAPADAGKAFPLASLGFSFSPTFFLANPAKHHRKKNLKMIYYYFKDHKGQWRWLLKASNGRPIAASGEAYEDEKDCLYDIELVKASSSCLVKKQAMSAHQ